MKAKEYFRVYKEENQDKSYEWRLVNALRKMVLEVEEIAKLRNAQSDNALIAIFNEQNLKAQSFIRMVNDTLQDQKIRGDAFVLFVKEESPDLAKMIWPEN